MAYCDVVVILAFLLDFPVQALVMLSCTGVLGQPRWLDEGLRKVIFASLGKCYSPRCNVTIAKI